jgi:hypothetical protein
VRTLRRFRSDVAFVGRATAGNDFDWQGLGLVTAEVASAFRLVFEALSDRLLPDTHMPDRSELDQTIGPRQTRMPTIPARRRAARSPFPSSSIRSAGISAMS